MPETRPPSVDAVVRRMDDGSLPRPLIVDAVRGAIDTSRTDPSTDIETEARRRVAAWSRTRQRRVINATGVILHTNLGRAPWSAAAVQAAAEAGAQYGNVELDLDTGDRGSRNAFTESLLSRLTGAEAALVVNNNAAAVFLVLVALAAGRPVPVSRGELVEIGGSYRLPELMASTGAILEEVGTTNRTRVADYAAVVEPALILKVHPSNYRIVGFSEEASLTELGELAAEREVPLVFDAGSGLLDERVPWMDGPPPTWLRDEPGIRQALESGADLVLFSGDKLLGGPQAGIIVGKAVMVDRLRRHPAARALRVDGSTSAALGATLEAYLGADGASIPLWRMASLSLSDIEQRADRLRARSSTSGLRISVVDGASALGAGSAPGAEIPTRLVRIEDDGSVFDRLLAADPPILVRRAGGAVIVDLRTVDPDDDATIAAVLGAGTSASRT